jgi:hypothetical protein
METNIKKTVLKITKLVSNCLTFTPNFVTTVHLFRKLKEETHNDLIKVSLRKKTIQKLMTLYSCSLYVWQNSREFLSAWRWSYEHKIRTNKFGRRRIQSDYKNAPHDRRRFHWSLKRTTLPWTRRTFYRFVNLKDSRVQLAVHESYSESLKFCRRSAMSEYRKQQQLADL